MHKIPKILLLTNFINHLIRRDRLNNSFNIKLKKAILYLLSLSAIAKSDIPISY